MAGVETVFYSLVIPEVVLTGIGLSVFIYRSFRSSKRKIKSTLITIDEANAIEQTLSFINEQAQNLDAIIVSGGGRPYTASEPPLYVQSRCDVSVMMYDHSKQAFGENNAPKLLCTSAGTAHTPQFLNDKELPVWESFSSAQYILDNYASIKKEDVYIETVSYDTIGNAYFAKILFSDPLKWQNIAIITNDWHAERTKAIFEWIFSIKSGNDDDAQYNLTLISVKSTEAKDLSDSARKARVEREEKSLKSVYKLREKYDSLQKVHDFLFTQHSMYSSPNRNESDVSVKKADGKLMAAYGFSK